MVLAPKVPYGKRDVGLAFLFDISRIKFLRLTGNMMLVVLLGIHEQMPQQYLNHTRWMHSDFTKTSRSIRCVLGLRMVGAVAPSS